MLGNRNRRGVRTEPTVLPPSSGQQRMWFVNRLENAGAAYPVAAVVRLTGALALDAGRAFGLRDEPPCRATVYALPPHEHVLMPVVHHTAVGGRSLRVLARGLSRAYAARSRGRERDWPPLPVTYPEFACVVITSPVEADGQTPAGHDDGESAAPLAPGMRQFADRGAPAGPLSQAAMVWTPAALTVTNLTGGMPWTTA